MTTDTHDVASQLPLTVEAPERRARRRVRLPRALANLDVTYLRHRGAQSLRVGWYAAHYALSQRLATAGTSNGVQDDASVSRESLREATAAARKAMQALFDADRANIAAGLYPAPRDLDVTKLSKTVADSWRYFEDLPQVTRRRTDRKGGVEVRSASAPNTAAGRPAMADGPNPARYPTYYLQNFHYQTDGWMSRRSAKLYDTQVEVLFTGAADAMRRMALAQMARDMRGQDQRSQAWLDVACGTGRFLEQALSAFPRVQATGLDLSGAYLEEARARLAAWPRTALVEANAEAIPLPEASFDAVSCIYLFHELPPRVRPVVAAQLARVVKPGGLLVVADSLQYGDMPALDPFQRLFPREFHEPYYDSYCREDFDAMFGALGLERTTVTLAFLTKVTAWRKPG